MSHPCTCIVPFLFLWSLSGVPKVLTTPQYPRCSQLWFQMPLLWKGRSWFGLKQTFVSPGFLLIKIGRCAAPIIVLISEWKMSMMGSRDGCACRAIPLCPLHQTIRSRWHNIADGPASLFLEHMNVNAKQGYWLIDIQLMAWWCLRRWCLLTLCQLIDDIAWVIECIDKNQTLQNVWTQVIF